MKLSFGKEYFRQYPRTSNFVHEPMPTTWQVFTIGGEKFFQLDCYSEKTDIDSIGPSLQSKHKLQFDRETAQAFIALLKKQFDLP